MKRLFWLIAVFSIGGVGGIFFDRFAVPYLAQTQVGRLIPALRRITQRTTIVNRTEVVRVEETEAIPDLADRVKGAVVPVEVVQKPKKGSGKVSTTSSKEFLTGLALTSDGIILLHADPVRFGAIPRLVENGVSKDLEILASSTSTHFVLLRAVNTQFTVLPFADNTPRLGSRLFLLSQERLAGEATPVFRSTMLSASLHSIFALSIAPERDAVIVNFEGEVIGMSIENNSGERVVISAEDIKNIGERLLGKPR